MRGSQPLPSPSRVADTDTYDGAVSQIIRLGNGDLLLFYHENDLGHVGPGGRVVVRRSADYGQTWSEPRRVHEAAHGSASNPSVVYESGSNRITLLDEVIRFTGSVDGPVTRKSSLQVAEASTYLTRSTDDGRTWGAHEDVSSQFSGRRATPHGGWVQSSEGLHTFFYTSNGRLEMFCSDDRGGSWTAAGPVASSPDGRRLTEPVPCAVTEEKLLLFGRDQATGDFYALRSADAGETWDDPVFFNPTGSMVPNPIWVKRTGPNQLTGVWGDRGDGYLYAITCSAQLAWQDPRTFATEPRRRIHERLGPDEAASYWDGRAGDFGYPTFVQLGPGASDVLMVFYDESTWPNIWQMALC